MITGPLLLAHAVDQRSRYHAEVLSGDGVFAAVGARIWSETVHLVGRIGSDFPQAAIELLQSSGIHTKALTRVQGTVHPRVFYRSTSKGIQRDTNPAVFFRTIERPLPKQLIHLPEPVAAYDEYDRYPPFASRPEDIPTSLWPAVACLVTSDHYLTQISIPVFMRGNGAEYVIITPPTRCLQPDFSEKLPILLSGVTAAIISSSKLPHTIKFYSSELRDYARVLGNHGSKYLVFTGEASGQLVWDHARETLYHIPAYPGIVADEMGAAAAFAGGFLAGLVKTGDALEAALHGSISASLVIEGTPALHALDALPGLADARLDALRGKILEVVL
ncbi:MAG: hypothetical protein JXA25_03240 [Anaerolineales bacterium]|nr:hypothetical protein [Anaerolineales bacterium]